MLTINKTNYKKLQKYEKHLNRGINDYVYGVLPEEFEEMLDIYKKMGGKERLRYSCNSCVLRLTKSLGEVYFTYKKQNQEDVTNI